MAHRWPPGTAEAAQAARRTAGFGTVDAPLGARTTYRVGGPAAVLFEPATMDQLVAVARAVQSSGLPMLVLGRGSNLLVADAGFPGAVLALGPGFEDLEIGDGLVRAGAAVSLPVLARHTARAGWRSLEWCVGVPGSVGGAVRMNAGGHGADTAATLERVRVLDTSTGQDEVVAADDLDLAYRHSSVASHHVVVWAEHRVMKGESAEAEAEIKQIVAWRRSHQPGGANAGSVFTNPVDDSAGRLVDASGGKGLRVGTAEVSEKHANFIQADAGGSADDVFALMVEVQHLVERATSIRLIPETVLVGFPPEAVADLTRPPVGGRQ